MFLQSSAPFSLCRLAVLQPFPKLTLWSQLHGFHSPADNLGLLNHQASLGDFLLLHPAVGPCLSSEGCCSKVPMNLVVSRLANNRNLLAHNSGAQKSNVKLASRTRLCLPDDKREEQLQDAPAAGG